jgi:large subunit ribosomal protein L10
MPLSKVEKEALVSQYQEGLAKAPHAYLVAYKGIKVAQVTELRSRIRETGGRYEVVKNSLALLAIRDQPLESLKDSFDGPVAVAYSQDDAVALAKALTEFAKTVPALSFRGGVVEGRPVAAEQIEEIAKLPSREELVAKLVFLLQSPIVRLVRTLNAVPQSFAMVLDQIARKKGA